MGVLVSRVGHSRLGAAIRTFGFIALTATGIAGCGSNSSLLDGDLLGTTSIAEPQQIKQAVGKPVSRIVAYRSPLGPPENVGGELTRQLNDAASDQGIALVIDPAVKADLTLRGYVTAMRKGPSVNISYLWDVLDSNGKRVTRLSGEETLKDDVNGREPWDAVTPVVSRMIAQKTINQLGKWVNSSGSQVAGGSADGAAAGVTPRGGGAGLTSAR